MAALTITSIADVHPQFPILQVGGLKARLVTLTFDSGTDAGGASLTAADLGLAEVFMVNASIDAGDNGVVVGGGFVPQYNYATNKLQFFVQTDPADAGGANVPLVESDLSVEDVQVRALVLGV